MTQKRWAYLLCRFSDQPQEPRPPTFYRDYFTADGAGLGGAFDYWRDVTLGRLDLSGSQVFGWFGIPHSSQELTGLTFPGGRSVLAQWGVDAAAANQVNLTGFDAIMVLYNIATDHGSAGGNRVVISYEAGRWEPTFIFHEMGHGMGLDHSWSTPPDLVYGDRWDIMSAMNVWAFDGRYEGVAGATTGPGLNAHSIERLTGLPLGRVWTAPAGQTHDVTLAALNAPEVEGFLVAKIPGAPGYTVEFRQRAEWDRGIPEDVILVHEVRANTLSYLLANGILNTPTASVPLPNNRGTVQVLNMNGAASTTQIRVTLTPPDAAACAQLATRIRELQDKVGEVRQEMIGLDPRQDMQLLRQLRGQLARLLQQLEVARNQAHTLGCAPG